jgi:archaellum component FlaC
MDIEEQKTIARVEATMEYIKQDISAIKVTLGTMSNTYDGIRQTLNVNGNDIVNLKDANTRQDIRTKALEGMCDEIKKWHTDMVITGRNIKVAFGFLGVGSLSGVILLIQQILKWIS